MGKLDTEPVLHHFSHQHPLKLVNFQPQTPSLVVCSGCKLEASGWIYSCSTCNYCLHTSCSQIPQNFNHPIDPNHTLMLLSSPVYPEGAFKCNACGTLGDGFCYHCKECQLDLHILCAFMPSSVKHNAHLHTLNLCFYPPYDNREFQCDVCKIYGSNCWLYHCSSCDFDAHINCVMANTQSQPTSGIQQREQHQLVKSRSVPPQILPPTNDYSSWNQPHRNFSPPGRSQPQQMRIQSLQTQYPVPGNGFSNWNHRFDQVNYYGGAPTSVFPHYEVFPHYVERPRTNRTGNNLMGSVFQGLVEGFSQQAGQAVVQGIFGG
ncbi:hypothetical protein L1049_008123 [Liquidambar formosana]|uniref:Zinc finger PHD-type domain-containing protein n=1 Tax=Liquidambar formosana TaxID=63359 RepID=A0AAP0X4D2_LIQFO